MFQSYEIYKHLGYDQKTNQYKYLYRIIDDEFENVEVEIGVDARVAIAIAIDVSIETGIGIGVIDVYENRNLNVAANLVAAFQFINRRKYGTSISNIVKYNKKYNPKYPPYAAEVDKYLAWI